MQFAFWRIATLRLRARPFRLVPVWALSVAAFAFALVNSPVTLRAQPGKTGRGSRPDRYAAHAVTLSTPASCQKMTIEYGAD